MSGEYYDGDAISDQEWGEAYIEEMERALENDPEEDEDWAYQEALNGGL